MSTHFWWYLSRAAGLTSLALAMVSVTTGLAISGRLSTKRLRLPWSNDLHRYLSVLTVAFLMLHLGALAFDSYAPFSIAAMAIPGASAWRTGAIAWGVIALWTLVMIDLSSRFRSRLKARTWRMLHLGSALVYVTALLHAFQAGPDMTLSALQVCVAAVVVLDLGLLGRRLWRLVRRGSTGHPEPRSAIKPSAVRSAR